MPHVAVYMLSKYYHTEQGITVFCKVSDIGKGTLELVIVVSVICTIFEHEKTEYCSEMYAYL